MFDDDVAEGTGHPIAALVDAVSTGSAEAVDAALFSLPDDRLAQLVVEHERAARAFAAVGLAILRQAERCELGRTVGASSTPDWLRDVLRLAPSEANARTDLAVRLDVDAAALDHGAQVIATWQRDHAAQNHRTGYPRPDTVVDTTADHSERRSPLGLDADAVEVLAGCAGGLPVTAAAVRAGMVSVSQAAVIARHLGNLPLGLDASTRADCEAFLATRALEHEPRALGRLGAQLVTTLTQRETDTSQHGADDDATADAGGDEGTDAEPEHPGQQSAQDRRRANADARTFFSLIDDGDGTVRAAGCFSEEAADLIRSALAPLAAPAPAVDGVKDQRPHAKRQALALVELCRRSLDEGSLPGSRGARPHISITATLDDLHDVPGSPGGVTAWGTPVPPDDLRRIGCDASVTRVVTDVFGVPLHTNSAKRSIPSRLWTALVVRDQGCTFPGCARPAAWCQAHHVWHWADGGPTTLTNLVLLCTRHHSSVHHDGWRVRIGDDGHPEYVPPPWIDPDRNPRRNIYHRLPTALSRSGKPEPAPP